MGLIDLKTDLKSLKYGKDTPGGGNSKQPFIKSKIPDGLTPKSPDFLLRNGYLSPVSTIEDIARLSKFFTTTEGVLFTAKQNLLSRTAVSSNYTPGVTINNPLQLNEGVYTPLSTLAQAGVVSLGGHLNKQGLNPFAETGVDSKNPNLYFNKVNISNNINGYKNNRLIKLTENSIDKKTETINILTYPGGPGSILGVGTTNIKFADQRTGVNSTKPISSAITWTPNQSEQNNPDRSRRFKDLLLSSATGVTNVYFETNNTELLLQGELPTNSNYTYKPGSEVGSNGKLFNPNDGAKKSETRTAEDVLNYQEQTDLSNPTRGGVAGKWNSITRDNLSSIGKSNSVYEIGDNNKPNLLKQNDSIFNAQNTYVLSQTQILSQSKQSNPFSPTLKDFRKDILSSSSNSDARYVTSFGIDYNEKNIDTPDGGGMNSPGQQGDRSNYIRGKLLPGETSPKVVDLINNRIVNKQEGNVQYVDKDFCYFYIKFINSNEFIQFRAFLDSISDSFNPNWNSFKYPGRGESFYTYEGFERKINLGWTVAALSTNELDNIYGKLNYLASATTPEYSGLGYMKGVLTELTIGNYIKDMPGFINSLTYTISTDTPWEIGIDENGDQDSDLKSVKNQLPHVIKVDMNYTPILNDIPRFDGINSPKFINIK